jgi:predicted outer membrane repeat protein
VTSSQLCASRVFIIFIFLQLHPIALPAAVLQVDHKAWSAYASIQQAIDAAQPNDTIRVASGRYLEALVISSKSLRIEGTPGGLTEIDATGTGRRVITTIGEQSSPSRLSLNDLVLRGGGNAQENGGGILSFDVDLLLNRVDIRDCVGMSGGGIRIQGSSPQRSVRLDARMSSIQRCTAARNGGGIAARNYVELLLDGVTVSENETSHGDGGGIWVSTLTTGQTVISRCVIAYNSAGDHGGGIYAAHAANESILSLELNNTLVAHNISLSLGPSNLSGGGAYFEGVVGTMQNCTIVHNSGNGWYVSGVTSVNSKDLSIQKNIIAYNVGVGLYCDQTDVDMIRDNAFWANGNVQGISACWGIDAVNGNLLVWPSFCDSVSGSFELAKTSPLVANNVTEYGWKPVPACEGGVVIKPTTWSKIKSGSYRRR